MSFSPEFFGVLDGLVTLAHGADDIVAGVRQMYSGAYTQTLTEWLLQKSYVLLGQTEPEAAANAAAVNNAMTFLLTLGSSLTANWSQIVQAYKGIQGLSGGALQLVGAGGPSVQVQIGALASQVTPLLEALAVTAVKPAVAGTAIIIQMSIGGGPSQQRPGNPLGEGTATRGTESTLNEPPRLNGQERGYWQKQLQNKKITEDELRQLLRPEDSRL